jgi:hypothetical protein
MERKILPGYTRQKPFKQPNRIYQLGAPGWAPLFPSARSERLRHRHNVGFDKSMETGTTRYGSQLLKVPAIHKDGRTLSIAFSVAMLFDENHKVTGVAAVVRDETARWLEERELKQRLASYEAKSAAIPQTSTPGDAKT